MTALDIYLIGLFDSLSFYLAMLASVSFAVGFVLFIMFCETEDRKYLKVSIWGFVIAYCFTTINVFIPSSKTALAMHTVPPVVEAVQTNKELQKLPDNVVKFVNMWLEENTKDKEK